MEVSAKMKGERSVQMLSLSQGKKNSICPLAQENLRKKKKTLGSHLCPAEKTPINAIEERRSS